MKLRLYRPPLYIAEWWCNARFRMHELAVAELQSGRKHLVVKSIEFGLPV